MVTRDFRIPRELEARLAAVAKRHGFRDAHDVACHFVTKGLSAWGVEPSGSVRGDLKVLVASKGYSAVSEAVEHLLVRGLRAYEPGVADSKEFETRLRGLGYIE